MKNSNEHQNNESQHTTTGSNKKILSWFGGTLLVLLAVVFVIFMVMNRDPTITGSAVRDVNIGSTSTIVPSVADTSNDNPVFFATPASRPSIISTNPISAARNVPTSRDISVTFNQEMDPRTINEGTFTLRKESNGALVRGIITSNSAGRVWTFTPVNGLTSNAVYIATINTGARDVSGNSLSSDYVWNFKTKSSGSSGGGGGGSPTTTTTILSVSGQSGVNLGSASNFAILAGSAVTNIPTSAITGDVGLSPSTGTNYAGLTAGEVTGTIYAVDVVGPAGSMSDPTLLAAAKLDLTTAYLNIQGRAGPAIPASGDLNGLTLVPGLYESGTSIEISPAGKLTLDAQGDANAVFIIRSASTITTESTSQVILAGGAQAKNIYWLAGSSVTLGVNSVMKGTILALQSITLLTGANLEGRALTQIAAVTLDSNTITVVPVGSSIDNTAPLVISNSVNPAANTVNVVLSSNVIAIFSEAMNPLTINDATFTLSDGTTPVLGTVTYLGMTATFNPTSNLASNKMYTAKITTGAKDAAGNPLATNFTWNFTTIADTTAPSIATTSPADASTNVLNVLLGANVFANFNEEMDTATINDATFTLMNGVTPVAGSVTYSGLVATFNPTSNLAADTLYTATITTGAKDAAGNALAASYVWSFTTGTPIVGSVQSEVNLGTAGDFVILSDAGITTTGNTHITGDIGVGPAVTSTAMTGFGLIMDSSNTFATSSLVIGNVYAYDYAVPTPVKMNTAILNMQTAYTDAAGRTLPDATELGAGNIGGLTLAPGLYKWSSNVLIPTDLTLDAQENENAVWIFQIAGDLTVSDGKVIHLINGAQAKNIFWQTFGVAELGTTAQFEGNILSQTSIVLNTGATLNGRALAQTAVTLDQATVTIPA